MIKTITTLFMLFSLSIGGMINTKIDYNALNEISARDLTKMFAEKMTSEFNLPITIDSATKLLNIYSFGTTIVHTKQINIDAKVVKNWHHKISFKSAMYQGETQLVCNNPVWRYFIFKRNIIAEFDYLDQNNKPLYSYTIGIDECSIK